MGRHRDRGWAAGVTSGSRSPSSARKAAAVRRTLGLRLPAGCPATHIALHSGREAQGAEQSAGCHCGVFRTNASTQHARQQGFCGGGGLPNLRRGTTVTSRLNFDRNRPNAHSTATYGKRRQARGLTTRGDVR
jgi:hypothetical protein